MIRQYTAYASPVIYEKAYRELSEEDQAQLQRNQTRLHKKLSQQHPTGKAKGLGKASLRELMGALSLFCEEHNIKILREPDES